MAKIKKLKRFRLKTPSCKYSSFQIQKAIQKEKIKKEGITSKIISCFLARCPDFLGCFAQDQLGTINIKSLPVFLVVNFDHSFSEGTHWIALRISKTSLEIFDPLGFNTKRWPNIPHFLLGFLNKYSTHRKIMLSKEIQPFTSTLCGFYCIFFVLYRSYNTFKSCVNLFSNKLYKNDDILYHIFNKI